MSSDLSIYYEEAIVYNSDSGQIQLIKGIDLMNTDKCYVMYDLTKFYFVEIRFDNSNMYIKHTAETSENLYIKIQLTIDQSVSNTVVKKDSYTQFFNNFNGNENSSDHQKKSSLALRELINNIGGEKVDVSFRNSNPIHYLVKLEKNLYVSTIPTGSNITISTADIGTFSDKKSATLKMLTIPKSTIQSCKRIGYGGGDGKIKDPEAVSERVFRDKQVAIYVFLALFFVIVIGGILIYNIDTEGKFHELISRMTQKTQSGGSGVQIGGSCAIPGVDSFEFRLPTPSILGYFKMSAFLLFLNMMIFGGNPVRERKIKHKPPPARTVEQHTEDRKAFIGTGIAVMVISFMVVLGFKSNDQSLSSGLNFISLTLYNQDTIAVYPAVLAYLVFYTNFVKLAENDVELPEFMMFFVSFLLLSGYAMFAAYNGVKSFRSMSFIVMVICLVITLLVVGGIIIKDIETQKKKEEGG